MTTAIAECSITDSHPACLHSIPGWMKCSLLFSISYKMNVRKFRQVYPWVLFQYPIITVTVRIVKNMSLAQGLMLLVINEENTQYRYLICSKIRKEALGSTRQQKCIESNVSSYKNYRFWHYCQLRHFYHGCVINFPFYWEINTTKYFYFW